MNRVLQCVDREQNTTTWWTRSDKMWVNTLLPALKTDCLVLVSKSWNELKMYFVKPEKATWFLQKPLPRKPQQLCRLAAGLLLTQFVVVVKEELIRKRAALAGQIEAVLF